MSDQMKPNDKPRVLQSPEDVDAQLELAKKIINELTAENTKSLVLAVADLTPWQDLDSEEKEALLEAGAKKGKPAMRMQHVFLGPMSLLAQTFLVTGMALRTTAKELYGEEIFTSESENRNDLEIPKTLH